MTVGVLLGKGSSRLAEDALKELGLLTQTAGGVVVERALQKRERPDAATFIGKGKAEELAGLCREQGISTVIFDDPLSPAQQRNLEAIFPVKVLDRTRLILDIFASRAASAEGSLQVELAQLSYLLPRLTGKGAALSQQVGGIGTRGPGEKKLEVDQRRIRGRIDKLEGEIERVRQARKLRRERRREIPLPVVTLIGYTNAGKSTLLNAFAKHRAAYTDDRLFATLDPLTRRVKLPSKRFALLTDTVGFIRKLPHPLVAAFKATLEEVSSSDLLLQVMDATSPALSQERDVVESVLEMLSAHQIPRILVYNKVDLLPSSPRPLNPSSSQGKSHLLSSPLEGEDSGGGMSPPSSQGISPSPSRGEGVFSREKPGEGEVFFPYTEREGYAISAKTNEGLERLARAMDEQLDRPLLTERMVIPYARAGALKRIRAAGLVKEIGYSRRGIRVEVRADSKNLSILKAAVNGKRG